MSSRPPGWPLLKCVSGPKEAPSSRPVLLDFTPLFIHGITQYMFTQLGQALCWFQASRGREDAPGQLRAFKQEGAVHSVPVPWDEYCAGETRAEKEDPASNLAVWEVSFPRCLGQESSWNGSEWPQRGVTASTWGLFGLPEDAQLASHMGCWHPRVGGVPPSLNSSLGPLGRLLLFWLIFKFLKMNCPCRGASPSRLGSFLSSVLPLCVCTCERTGKREKGCMLTSHLYLSPSLGPPSPSLVSVGGELEPRFEAESPILAPWREHGGIVPAITP